MIIESTIAIMFLILCAYFLKPESNKEDKSLKDGENVIYINYYYKQPTIHWFGKFPVLCPGEKYCNFPGLH